MTSSYQHTSRTCGKSIVPKVEQVSDLVFTNGGLLLLRHSGRVMMRDLPFIIFVHVQEGVSSLDFVSGGPHSEFIDTGILSPVGTLDYFPVQNDTLRLQGQKSVKVILDGVKIRTRSVRQRGK